MKISLKISGHSDQKIYINPNDLVEFSFTVDNSKPFNIYIQSKTLYKMLKIEELSQMEELDKLSLTA